MLLLPRDAPMDQQTNNPLSPPLCPKVAGGIYLDGAGQGTSGFFFPICYLVCMKARRAHKWLKRRDQEPQFG